MDIVTDSIANPFAVSNLVNFSNLERVFGQIFEKLEHIENRIGTVETEVSKKVSLSQFLSLQHEYESNITLFENRLQQLEHSVTPVKSLIEKVNGNSSQISKLKETQKKLITSECVEVEITTLEENLKTIIDKISNNKCNNTRAKKLEESQHDIIQQISALECMLQCKVDRSQIPLIESCQKQLNSLERFRDQISQRVCIMDDQLSDIINDLSTKVEQTEWNENNQEIEDRFSHKVDNKFLNDEVIKRLNQLANDVLLLLQEHKQISMTECYNQLKDFSETIKEIKKENELHKQKLSQFSQQIFKVPSLQQFDQKADRSFAEQLTDECKQFCRTNNTKLHSSMTNVNEEVESLKTMSNKLNEQMAVVLRFVDWYSSVELNK